ncbi:ABC transporter substrate-binding protein [Pectinatus brassicae]|uniref:Polar amino acid transport system substrate-binding protein n=1 Tax=Pectinatus brassicae TaxID=862415 RepID=A0A840UKG1_9FIRM|nr:ABC transporter substrate-binding protein [Pectinatus brassicae]MBB5335198.1 polar amino acid transport system substrate-binding protein [Pectinatus brassicae]
MRKHGKKILVLVMLVLSSLFLLVGCGSENSQKAADNQSTLAKIKEKGVLVVGSSNDAPFAYMDTKTNQFAGIDAEIITEIAKRLGIKKVEMKHVPFENLLIGLNNEAVDMVTDGMYIKPERLQKAAFTNIWYKEGEAIVVKKDSPIKSKADLKDKVIGGQKGVTFLELAEKWKKDGEVKDVKVFNSQAELMMAVNTGKIDACITDGIVAAYTIKTSDNLDVKILSPYKAEASGQIGAAVRFKDKDLLDAVNGELEKMRADGSLKKILEKYGLTEDFMVLSADEAKTKNVK